MLQLAPDVLVALNAGVPQPATNQAVIAAGTGLGEAIICRIGEAVHVIATEGGHTDMAPNRLDESALFHWLRARFSDHVSYERVLSGPGLVHVYQYLADQQALSITGQIPAATLATPESITQSASDNLLCAETIRLFCRIYGAGAGNLALKSMARGGVFTGGGIAPAILPWLREEFMPAFCGKGRLRGLLADIPVWVAAEMAAPPLGAAWRARVWPFAIPRVIPSGILLWTALAAASYSAIVCSFGRHAVPLECAR